MSQEFDNGMHLRAMAHTMGRTMGRTMAHMGDGDRENDQDQDQDRDGDGETGIVTKTRPKTKKPALYRVLMLNDDYTPMEFVVHVLQRFFNMGHDDSVKIMLHVHQRGVGVCGVYTYEVAETKVTQVVDFARKHEHPLQCTLEKE